MAVATEEYYEVFAAERAQEAPRHVGTVRARSAKDAVVFAYTCLLYTSDAADE